MAGEETRDMMCLYTPAIIFSASLAGAAAPAPFELVGVSVTPHVRAPSTRFRRDPGEADGALVRLLVRGTGEGRVSRNRFCFNGELPMDLVEQGAWAWSDVTGDEGGARTLLPEGAVTVRTPDPELRSELEARRLALIAEEAALGFDPARSDADFALLEALVAD